MSKIQELEPVIRGAIEGAIRSGFTLISGDWGIRRNEAGTGWEPDTDLSAQPLCCAIGAVLLGLQLPKVESELDDFNDSAAAGLGVDRLWIRDFDNGFDGDPFQGGDEEAYELGRRLSLDYCPLRWDMVMEMPAEALSGTRLRTVPPCGDEEITEDWDSVRTG